MFTQQHNYKVLVSKEKYLEIIGFTAFAYLTNKISKYSGIAGGRMRTLGEYIENFIYGKVAEEALKIFLKNELEISTLTEIDIADFYFGVYLPDIVLIKRDNEFATLKFWIDVKEVRRDQKWLLIPGSSYYQRPYDAYVAVWVGLPPEHLIWAIQYIPYVKDNLGKDWADAIYRISEKIENIECNIIGFVTYEDMNDLAITALPDSDKRKVDNARRRLLGKFGEKGFFYFDGNTNLFDPEDPSWQGSEVAENFGFYLKCLNKSSEWGILRELLVNNNRTVPRLPLPKTKAGKISKKIGLPDKYASKTDLRSCFQDYLDDQLESIKKKYGRIQRNKSWYSQIF